MPMVIEIVNRTTGETVFEISVLSAFAAVILVILIGLFILAGGMSDR